MSIPPELTDKLLDSFSKTTSVAEKAAEEGGKWLDAFIEKRGIDKDNLSKAEWFLLAMEIPCTIRCWRIGEPVDVKPGEKCPECGKTRPIPTAWERLLEDD
jgi:hypothetical protein